MTLHKWCWALSTIIFMIAPAYCFPEQGKWDVIVLGQAGAGQEKSFVLTKSLYKGATFVAKVLCEPGPLNEELQLNITWYIRKAACWKEYAEITEPIPRSPSMLFEHLVKEGSALTNETTYYIKQSDVHPCDDKSYYLTPSVSAMVTKSDAVALHNQAEAKAPVSPIRDTFREKRGTVDSAAPHPPSKTSLGLAPVNGAFYQVRADGIYQLVLGVRALNMPRLGGQNISFKAHLHIEIANQFGYLSAADYPLLIFYGAMCGIYLAYGVGWLVVSFLRWRELLRVQYWVGAVILLGMLEKAVFTAEYESVNQRGTSVPGLIVCAELVSCAKRTLARMLVIIVSFGFGIVKPRLGLILHRVIGIGLLYFILASIEACMRALEPKVEDENSSRRLVFAIIPLSLLESAICWWVFSALVSTTRTLRLRRNTIKLNLYRHFTNTLVFAVVASIIFMIWSIRYQNFDPCVSDWKQLWVSNAFWHVLFAIILLVIMILWRPTNNNQRFAFSPLLDEGSDGDAEEEEERLMADISDTMKLRSAPRGSSTPSPRESRTVDDDLKWVEENIPASISDTGLPVVDSDEEILTTKFEISKMQ